MTPLFFPYTYISNPVAEAVASCFGRFTVYQPLSDGLPPTMATWVDKGHIDIRTPVTDDGQKLKSAVLNYRRWADVNIGSARINPAVLKTLQASGPLLDAPLSSQIVADVKKQIGGPVSDESSDPVFAARIFLYFAQKFDQQSQELDHVLAGFHKKAYDLIRDIKVEEDALADELIRESGRIPEVNADYLIPRRLQAWTRLFIRDREPSALLVTHSAAVLAHLLDGAPSAEKILDIEALPRLTAPTGELAAWQNKLMSYLTDVLDNKLNPASGGKSEGFDIPASGESVSLKIHLVPNQYAPRFFCRRAGIKLTESDPTPPAAAGRSTILCLVGP